MPASIKTQQKANIIINNDRDSAVPTALTGRTVYSLPKSLAKRDMVDLVLMIMDEDGPMPMHEMRPAKKTRNAVDQFYDEHQVEYERRGQPACDQINRVHTHNNAFPKMYDELDKRRSIAQTPVYSSNENVTAKFDPTYPKCIIRKKRIEKERKRRGPLCKKCRDALNRKALKNKLDRVTKNKIPKPKKQLTPSMKKINEKNVLKHKSFHKKRVNKKPPSLKSDVNTGNLETETRPSVSSYNSFMSIEHEPMVE